MTPRRLYRQVADQLRQMIDSGEYPVGGRLPTERELAASLGISRPTVREALIALEVDGRVRIRVGSGIYVLPQPPTPATGGPASDLVAPVLPVAGAFEILAARALVEGAIAEQVASRATPADIDAIDAALARLRAVSGARAESIDADRAFHLAIAAALGNDAITKVVADLFDQRINPYFARLASHFENAASWSAALAEHTAIRDRLAARDPAGARIAMHEHLQCSQERFSTAFGDIRAPEATHRLPVARATATHEKSAVTLRRKQL
jgi:DNA-binding FadR family transcriptional regulator